MELNAINTTPTSLHTPQVYRRFNQDPKAILTGDTHSNKRRYHGPNCIQQMALLTQQIHKQQDTNEYKQRTETDT
jgi:hypothetical protein